jgi:hypothetical protein
LSKLFLVESPKTRIAWHMMPWTIQFDFLVGCLYGNLVPSFLSFRTSSATAALAIYRTVIKPSVVCCSCVVNRCFSCCCFYFFVVVGSFFFFFATLVVGFCTMTYVIFAPLYVGLWTLLYHHLGFFPSRMSGSFPLC